MKRLTAALVFLALCAPAAANAQAASDALISPLELPLFPSHEPFLDLPPPIDLKFTDGAAGFPPLPKYGSWVSIVKWLTLGTSVALGVVGFSVHNQADDAFAQLEQACNADPDNCRDVNPDGSYRDPRLESLYQRVLDKDDQARLSLLGAHISFGASVVLFIADFQKGSRPSDIPYEPAARRSALRLSVTPGELALRYYIR